MILKILDKIKSDELIKGSITLLLLINLFNFLNFLFHFVLARMLGPADYGVLAVIMSFVFIYGIPTEAIQTVISKYTSKFNIKGEYGKMKSLLIYSAKRLIIVAVGAFILFALIYIPLSKILKIDYGLLIIVNIMIFSFFLFPIIRGLLQGTKRFGALGWNMILESVLKLILAVILVYLGLRVFGAIIGVVGAFIIFFIVSFFFIRKIIKAQKEEINQKKILFGGAPILIVMLSIVLFYSIDIIIARAVFSDVMAGQYAVLSMIGKMIFFGTYAISKAMYPISTERFEENKSTKELIKKSLLIVLLLIILALLAISLFPRFIIWLLFGEDYTALAGNLIYVSIGFSILSVTNIILLYGLSKNKINFIPSLSMFLFIIAEVVLLSIFNDSITQFAVAFIGINFAMFIWSLVLVARKK